MDNYEGDNEEPLSLHKYLYADANPVNIDDPSGHDGDIMSLDVGSSLAAGLAAFGAATVFEAQTHVLGTLTQAAATEAISDGASFVETAKSALRAAGKTVRELIDEAKSQINQARNSPIKVVPIPRSVIPTVANHIANAQSLGYLGFPVPLTRCSPVQATINRDEAVRGLGYAFPYSWDEYPFASSTEGGSFTSVSPVPLWENCVQGGIISACYTIEKINPGVNYFVVVTP
jgi:hypothetical protein